MSDQFANAFEEAEQARQAVYDAKDPGPRALSKTLAALDRTINKVSRAAEGLKDSLETLSAHSRSYTELARQHFEEGQRYVAESVKKRPVATILASVGVGLSFGLLLASRSR